MNSSKLKRAFDLTLAAQGVPVFTADDRRVTIVRWPVAGVPEFLGSITLPHCGENGETVSVTFAYSLDGRQLEDLHDLEAPDELRPLAFEDENELECRLWLAPEREGGN